VQTADLELALRGEAAELAAHRSRYQALAGADVGEFRAGAQPLGAGELCHASADVLMFNMVLGLGVAAPAAEREVDDALRIYAEHGSPRCMIALAPCARPAELERWLAQRGFVRHNHWIRLARDVRPVAEARTDLRIAPFGRDRAREFGEMAGEAFGHREFLAPMLAAVVGCEGWRHLGAFDGEQLVGAGALFVHGDTAWFGSAATAATHRGRGAQSALIAARIDAAREAGCRWVAVETAADPPEKPNPSTHNLRRMGFRDLYERANWVKALREK
jgi:GNAT superfamily N-acetyltransferase